MSVKLNVTSAIMPIHPVYSESILSGRKRVEFRKVAFSRHPKYIFIYATSPIKCVVGLFEVTEIDVDTPKSLWAKYSTYGCISHDVYKRYYRNRAVGVALCIGDVIEFDSPYSLQVFGIKSYVPQSFIYVASDALSSTRLINEMSKYGFPLPRE